MMISSVLEQPCLPSFFSNHSPSSLGPPAGRSDPQLSFAPPETSPGHSPRHSVYQNSPARASPPSPGHDTQGGRPPRSPQGQSAVLRGHRQTMSWEGQSLSQNHIGPVR